MGDYRNLLCALALSTVLSSILQGHKTIKEHPMEEYEDGEESGGQGVRGGAEVSCFVQPREEENEWRSHVGLQLPHEGSRGGTSTCKTQRKF